MLVIFVNVMDYINTTLKSLGTKLTYDVMDRDQFCNLP